MKRILESLLEKIFTPKTIPFQKIGVFGIMNNPDYRQEPWRESISSRLRMFDVVCLVCGHEPDIEMLREAFPVEWASGKLKAKFKPWPFPEWSYEELPKHLNEALRMANEENCDWLIKLDIDTLFHEQDYDKLRKEVSRAHRKSKLVVSFKKLQFFLPSKYWQKGRLPIAIKTGHSIVYGFDKEKYTDLCQPIVWNTQEYVTFNGKQYDIPSGVSVPERAILNSGIFVYNYDFSFRTKERTIELLYQIEMAHTRFWGKGYTGLGIEKITRENAFNDFIMLSRNRYKQMNKHLKISSHPIYIQNSLLRLSDEHFGKNMWGEIK